MRSTIFRKVALDRLSSPEQLDLLMQVTSPKSWLAFLALVSIIATAVYWAIFGQIPLQKTSPAVLIPTGGIKNVIAVESGQFYAWRVVPGDIVEKNQIVAEILPLGQEMPLPVYSLYDGRILAQTVDPGQLIHSGDSLATLQFVGADVRSEAVLYLSPAEARQLRSGMLVTIVPVSTTGIDTLTGAVTVVGEYPVSPQQVARLLGNQPVIHSLHLDNNHIEVRVLIETDAPLPAGLVGTLASATIHLGSRRPIELVIPLR